MTTVIQEAQQGDHGRCACPTDCPMCGQPHGQRHDLDCPWTRGTAAHEWPAIVAEPTVTTAHTHQPGCPHVVRRPGGLSAQIDEDHIQCLMCGRLGTIEAESIDSFGGTTEHHQRCTACGQTWGWADISAIL